MPHIASHATSVAAASADPPPMPPAMGTCFSISRCTPPGTPAVRASSFAARTARFEASVGRPDVSMLPPNVTLNSSSGQARTSS